jgi:hypothetical protein
LEEPTAAKLQGSRKLARKVGGGRSLRGRGKEERKKERTGRVQQQKRERKHPW